MKHCEGRNSFASLILKYQIACSPTVGGFSSLLNEMKQTNHPWKHPRKARVTSTEELDTMSKKNLRGIKYKGIQKTTYTYMSHPLSSLANLLEILIYKSGLWQRKFCSSYFRRQSHCIQSDRSSGNQERWSVLDSCQRCLHRQSTCHCWDTGEWNTDLSSPVLLNTI